jgi:uncharacterized OsmC-like protein
MSSVGARRTAETSNRQMALISARELFVLPHDRRDGFWSSINGHVLDLADPDAGHALAPTPDDLFVVSIASELAWTARRILRGNALPDDVSVSAKWRTTADPPALSDITLTIAVSRRAEAASEALTAAVEKGLAARSLVEPVVHLAWEGANQ